jgi:hypothetical protein
MRMQVDAFGKVEVSHDHKVNDVKTDKDFSEVVYDNLNNRKRFNNFNDTYGERQEGKSVGIAENY